MPVTATLIAAFALVYLAGVATPFLALSLWLSRQDAAARRRAPGVGPVTVEPPPGKPRLVLRVNRGLRGKR